MDQEKPQFRILLDGESMTLEFQPGESILDAVLRAELPLSHSCGGNGSCGTCRVRILRGIEVLSPRNPVEAEMAEDRGFAEDERLACQTEVHECLEVEIES